MFSLVVVKNMEMTMPYGKGTYGNKVGRPPKKKKKYTRAYVSDNWKVKNAEAELKLLDGGSASVGEAVRALRAECTLAELREAVDTVLLFVGNVLRAPTLSSIIPATKRL